MLTHVKVLAVLFIALSALGVLMAIFLMAVFGVGAGIVGASGDPDAAVALPIIGLTGMALVIFILANLNFVEVTGTSKAMAGAIMMFVYGTGAAGLGWASWLKARRPEVYARIGT